MEQLLRYIVEEPPEEAESKRAFKYATWVKIIFILYIPLFNFIF